MASFTKKSNGSWLVQVRHKAGGGRAAFNKSAVFSRKVDAQQWAAKIEAEWQAFRAGITPMMPFSELLTRYRDEVSPTKRGFKNEINVINRVLKTPLADVMLPDLSDLQFKMWADQRLKEVQTATVRREWNVLSAVMAAAVKDWRLLPENYLLRLRKPDGSPPRTRRVSAAEVDAICYCAGYSADCVPDKQVQRVAAAFLFALETAMRVGEILSLLPENVHFEKRYVHLPTTKNGHARDVPLSGRAAAILKQVADSHGGRTVFGVTKGSCDSQFRKLLDMAQIDGLHFHDSRREALTRLAKIYQPMELAKISGHKDLRILLNTYYAPTAEELAAKMPE
ncbi:site-specific integrase [Neisseria musculi]|uniref:Phage integrase family protein n=1 Tax=Neisseria musculi TaxID=1815583 RepID=A0A7H1M9C9_9NEIS|nr:site-specific integrase [Neisseria musculi]QNT58244.1 phage integrase family protein [Neisseria musculi]